MRYEFERDGDRLGSVLWEGPGQVSVDVRDADLRTRFERHFAGENQIAIDRRLRRRAGDRRAVEHDRVAADDVAVAGELHRARSQTGEVVVQHDSRGTDGKQQIRGRVAVLGEFVATFHLRMLHETRGGD